jgi:hypothetical protein
MGARLQRYAVEPENESDQGDGIRVNYYAPGPHQPDHPTVSRELVDYLRKIFDKLPPEGTPWEFAGMALAKKWGSLEVIAHLESLVPSNKEK